MEVIVDGNAAFLPEGTSRTALEALAEVAGRLRKAGRTVMGVAVDGRDIASDRLIEELSAQAAGEIRRLEIRSQDVQGLVSESLAELEEVLPELPAVCRQLAELVGTDGPEAALPQFKQMVEIWEAIRIRQGQVLDALDSDRTMVQVNGESLSDRADRLTDKIRIAAEALAKKDKALLSDVLEYELAPMAEDEKKVVAALRALK